MRAYHGRTRLDVVVARHIIRAVAAAVLIACLGNLIALGCVIGWLHSQGTPGADRAALWFIAAALLHFGAGAAAVTGWSWAR